MERGRWLILMRMITTDPRCEQDKTRLYCLAFGSDADMKATTSSRRKSDF